MVIKSHYRKKNFGHLESHSSKEKFDFNSCTYFVVKCKTVKNDRPENYQTYMCICKNEAIIC